MLKRAQFSLVSSVLRMTVKRKRRKLRVTNNQMWSLLIRVAAEDPKRSVLGRLPLGGCSLDVDPDFADVPGTREPQTQSLNCRGKL